jgi:hypothetical protein
MGKILIDGQELELGKGIDGLPATTYERAAYQKLGTIQGEISNLITAPYTLRNQITLGVHDPTITSARKGLKTTTPAEHIGDNGLTILKGIVRVEELGVKGIKLRLSGGVADWATKIRGKSIKDIPLGRQLFSKAEILDSWAYENHTDSNKNVVWPLIDYGRLASIVDTTSVEVDSMRPAVFEVPIIEGIFNDIGFNVVFHGSVNNFIDNLIIPFTTDTIPVSADLLDAETVIAQKISTQLATITNKRISFTSEIQDDNDRWQVDTYTTSLAGQYRILIEDLSVIIEKTLAAPVAWVSYDVRINASSVFGTAANTIIDGPQVRNFVSRGDVYTLAATDTVDIVLVYSDMLNNEVSITSGRFSVTAVSIPFQLGLTFDVADTLPDIKQDDYIRSLVQSFNLIVETDSYAGTCDIYTESDYLLDQTQVKDWVAKTDMANPPSMESLNKLKKNLAFKYNKDDKDLLLKSWEKNLGDYADDTYVFDDEYLTGTQALADIPFAATRMGSTFTGVGLFVPQIINEDTAVGVDSFDFEPRRLIWKGLRSGGWKFDGITQINYPYAYFLSDESDIFTVNLCFKNNTLQNPNVVGLTERYYGDKLDRLNNSFLIPCRVSLNDLDINQLSFRHPYTVQFDTGNYVTGYLNRVEEYRDATKSTKVELIQIQ